MGHRDYDVIGIWPADRGLFGGAICVVDIVRDYFAAERVGHSHGVAMVT